MTNSQTKSLFDPSATELDISNQLWCNLEVPILVGDSGRPVSGGRFWKARFWQGLYENNWHRFSVANGIARDGPACPPPALLRGEVPASDLFLSK
jgi:hypothetical protein